MSTVRSNSNLFDRTETATSRQTNSGNAMIYDRYLGQYCLISSASAGVFAGIVEAIDRDCCILKKARRLDLWVYAGAFTLSQLCQEGVKRPDRCKFSCEVPEQGILGLVEILPCSDAAAQSIKDVPIWAAQKDELGNYPAMATPIQEPEDKIFQ